VAAGDPAQRVPGAQARPPRPGEASSPPSEPTPPAEPPTEPPESQLRLLSPQEPASDWQAAADRNPAPITLKSSTQPAEPSRSRVATQPRIRQFFAYAATYAAGRCRFTNCAQQGWNTPHTEGDSESRCLLGDCLQRGWTTTHPDGTLTQTSCSPGGCDKEGWATVVNSAANVPTLLTQSRCQLGRCFISGWSTTYPGGAAVPTRCLEDNCLKVGWTTRLPSGDTVECRCSLHDCVHNGAECR